MNTTPEYRARVLAAALGTEAPPSLVSMIRHPFYRAALEDALLVKGYRIVITPCPRPVWVALSIPDEECDADEDASLDFARGDTVLNALVLAAGRALGVKA